MALSFALALCALAAPRAAMASQGAGADGAQAAPVADAAGAGAGGLADGAGDDLGSADGAAPDRPREPAGQAPLPEGDGGAASPDPGQDADADAPGQDAPVTGGVPDDGGATPDGDAPVVPDAAGQEPAGDAPATAPAPAVPASEPVAQQQAAPVAKDPVIAPAAAQPKAKPSISYRSHVSNIGWKAYASNGGSSGGVSAGQDIEAVRVKLAGVSGGVSYRIYAKGMGWQSTRKDAATAGTTGKVLPIQAFRATLTGAAAKSYDLYYRVYVRGLGWLDWTRNWNAAGTVGYDRALQGLQMRLVRKSDPRPSSSNTAIPAGYLAAPKVSVSSHVQNIGWQAAVGNRKTSGTTGKALRVEALRAKASMSGLSGGLSTSAHVQNVGWRSWVGNGKAAGTTGKGLRMEAVKMKLTGGMAKAYDLYYRAHVQNVGWQGWVKAGKTAGTTGKGLRIEALQVYLTLKGEPAPVSPVKAPSSSFFYLDAGHGNSGISGYDSGAVGKGYFEATETKELVGKVAKYAKSLYGLKVFDGSTANLDYWERAGNAISMGCTSLVSIHFNAGGGTGTETWISSAGAASSPKLQTYFHNNLVTATGLTDRGKKDYDFSVLSSNLPAVLCEIAFIDNASDMSLYKKREDQIARALAKSMYQASLAGF